MFFPRKHPSRSSVPGGETMKTDFGGTVYFGAAAGMPSNAPFGATQHFPQMGNGYVLSGGPSAPPHGGMGPNSCFGGGIRMHTQSFHTGRGCHGWQRGRSSSNNFNQHPSHPPPPHMNAAPHPGVNMHPPHVQPVYEFVPIPMTWVAVEHPVPTVEPTKGYVPPMAPGHNHSGLYDANPQGFINGIKKLVNGFMNPNLNCDFYSDHTRHYNPKYRNNYVMDQRWAQKGYAQSPSRQAAPNSTNNCNANVKTATPDPQRSTAAQEHATNNIGPGAISATIEFTIFTNDDFPELPAVKKPQTPPPQTTLSAPHGGVSKVSDKLPRARRKPRHGKSPSPGRHHHRRRNQPEPADPAKPAANHNETKNFTEFGDSPKTDPATDITCRDFVVLPKPKSQVINVPVRPCAVNSTDQQQSCPTPSPGERPQFLWQRSPRIRQISECSDDSFVICFSEDAQEGVLEMARDSDGDDSDLESSGSDTESSSEDDFDETDNHHHYAHRKIADLSGQFDSGFDEEKKDKKVRFNLKPQVHVMHAWNFAYRAARKGHWENFVRDRDRFTKRINTVSAILNPILDTQHREAIYKARFECDSKNDDNNTTTDAKTVVTENLPEKSNQITSETTQSSSVDIIMNASR